MMWVGRIDFEQGGLYTCSRKLKRAALIEKATSRSMIILMQAARQLANGLSERAGKSWRVELSA